MNDLKFETLRAICWAEMATLLIHALNTGKCDGTTVFPFKY